MISFAVVGHQLLTRSGGKISLVEDFYWVAISINHVPYEFLTKSFQYSVNINNSLCSNQLLVRTIITWICRALFKLANQPCSLPVSLIKSKSPLGEGKLLGTVSSSTELLIRGTHSWQNASITAIILISLNQASTDIYPTRLPHTILLPLYLHSQSVTHYLE